jgi:hypothetical protein
MDQPTMRFENTSLMAQQVELPLAGGVLGDVR